MLRLLVNKVVFYSVSDCPADINCGTSYIRLTHEIVYLMVYVFVT